jgi:hypothetical protein
VPEGAVATLDREEERGADEALEMREELWELREEEEGSREALELLAEDRKRLSSWLARLLRLDMLNDSALIVESAATCVDFELEDAMRRANRSCTREVIAEAEGEDACEKLGTRRETERAIMEAIKGLSIRVRVEKG